MLPRAQLTDLFAWLILFAPSAARAQVAGRFKGATMDIILLPVVSRDEPPARALRAMKEGRRSLAAVADPIPGPVPVAGLITSLEVRKAKNSQQPDLKQAELMPVNVLYAGDFASAGYDRLKLPSNSFGNVYAHLLRTFPGMAHEELAVQSEDLPAFAKALPSNWPHGFLGFDRGAAVVMTSHETLAAQAGTPPADCCCMNPTTPHEYAAGLKRGGEFCENCGFSIEC